MKLMDTVVAHGETSLSSLTDVLMNMLAGNGLRVSRLETRVDHAIFLDRIVVGIFLPRGTCLLHDLGYLHLLDIFGTFLRCSINTANTFSLLVLKC